MPSSAAPRSLPAARAPPASRPASTGRRRSSTACRPIRSSRARRRSARSHRSSQIGSLDEAIGLANASPYGLLAAIFTRDLAQGLRFADEVRTGWVNVNESTNYWESHLPFGGRSGCASGTGRVGGSAPMEAFTELQTVVLTA